MSADKNMPAPRWWPFVMILLTAIAAIIWRQAAGDLNRQQAHLDSAAVGVVAIALSLFWLLFASRLPWRLRGGFAAMGVASIAGFFAWFRFDGVTGNLVPVFVSRWSAVPVFEPVAEKGVQLSPAAEGDLAALADFGQFFGETRDGRVADPGLIRDWHAQTPIELWRREIGAGWSGFAVKGRRALTQEQRGEEEVVSCYDILTGDLLWLHSDPRRYDNPLAGVGPRATPTIDGGMVFSMGGTGLLTCIDLIRGDLRWSIDTLEANDAPLPEWGVSCSPLVVGDRVIVSVGGRDSRSLVAYDRSDGAFVWGGGSAPAHWSSPILAAIGGRQQILIFNADLVAHDVDTGAVLWSHPWHRQKPHVALPAILSGDRVMISSGYGAGCELLKVEVRDDGRYRTESIWRSRRLKAKFANFVTKDGYVYGFDDGMLTCVDLADGSRVWKQGRYGHGQVLLVGDLLLIMAESGEVVLCEPDHEEHRELTRFTAFEEKAWNPPTLAGEFLLLRTDREAACYRLPVSK